MSKPQDRLYVGKGDRKIVEKIENNDYFNFKDKSRKEQFMFAMAYGVKSDIKNVEIKNKDEWFFSKDLQPEDKALMYSCAIYKNDNISVLKDINNVYEIAQNYAHIGFKVLSGLIERESFGAVEKKFEKEVKDAYEEFVK